MSALWEQMFQNRAPVEIEIGPERGTFLLATAARQPERNYIGIERSAVRTRRIERALARGPQTNVRILCGDAASVVAWCVPTDSVTAYHIYFPDPWWKRRHHRRRLLTAEFVAELERTLLPGGAIYCVTDVKELFDFARRNFLGGRSLQEAQVLPERPVRSAFEQKAMERGSRIYSTALVKVTAPAQRRSA